MEMRLHAVEQGGCELAPESTARPVTLRLIDGSTATVTEEALTLRDGDGRLLLRYADGQLELSAARGDLVLAAPNGRVRLQSGEDVRIEAARDLLLHGGRQTRIGSADRPQLAVEPDAVRVTTRTLAVEALESACTTDTARLVAHVATTTAQSLVTRVERYELEAHQLVERAHDLFCHVAGLWQSRVGRMRSVVKDVYALSSRRTVMISDEDTSIDGERILLG